MSKRLTEEQENKLLLAGFTSQQVTEMSKATADDDGPSIVEKVVDIMVLIKNEAKKEGCDPLTEAYDLNEDLDSPDAFSNDVAFKAFRLAVKEAHLTYLVDVERTSKLTFGQRLFTTTFVLDHCTETNRKVATQFHSEAYSDEEFERVTNDLIAKAAEGMREAVEKEIATPTAQA